MSGSGLGNAVTLRDGRQVQIREVQPGDGQALLAFYRAMPEEDRLFLRDDVTRPEWLERFLRRLDLGELTCFIALHEGEVVGETSLYRARHGWTRHVGEVRMATAPGFRRVGLGTALVRALTRRAISDGVDKLVSHVVENQISALRTLERLGFFHEATLRNHVTDIRGFKRDLLVFANDVSHIWGAMEALVSDYPPQGE